MWQISHKQDWACTIKNDPVDGCNAYHGLQLYQTYTWHWLWPTRLDLIIFTRATWADGTHLVLITLGAVRLLMFPFISELFLALVYYSQIAKMCMLPHCTTTLCWNRSWMATKVSANLSLCLLKQLLLSARHFKRQTLWLLEQLCRVPLITNVWQLNWIVFYSVVIVKDMLVKYSEEQTEMWCSEHPSYELIV